jgi:heat shock protein HslJ
MPSSTPSPTRHLPWAALACALALGGCAAPPSDGRAGAVDAAAPPSMPVAPVPPTAAPPAAAAAQALQGSAWVVEGIDERGIIDSSRVTIEFGPRGQLSGRAGCNTYRGIYAQDAGSLGVTGLAGTLMACAPALMNQEQRFLALLGRVQRHEITGDGALVLITLDARRIVARR